MFPHMVAAGTQLPPLPREDRHRLTLFFKLEENLASLAEELNRSLPAADHPASSPVHLLTSSPVHSSPNHPLTHSPLQPNSAPSTQHSAPCSSPDPHDEFSLQSWASRADIAAHIDFRRKEADRRHRQSALAALEHVLNHTQNLIEKRRAASTVLQTLNRAGSHGGTSLRGVRNPSSPRTADTTTHINAASSSHQAHRPHTTSTTHPPDPNDQDDDTDPNTAPNSDSPVHPLTSSPVHSSPPLSIPEAFTPRPGDIHSPPTPLPDPARTPEDLVALTIQAIQSPNLPERNTGPFTLWNLAGHITHRTPADFAEYRGNYLANTIKNAWEFASFSQRSLTVTPPAPPSNFFFIREFTALALIDLTLRDDSRRVLRIELRKETKGTFKDCWLLKHLTVSSRQTADAFNDSG